MPHETRGVIFSDLDGSFLDAAYQIALTQDEFSRVLERWTVVWVSSRTADELAFLPGETARLRDAFGENGGVLLTRGSGGDSPGLHQIGDASVVLLAEPRDSTERLVRQVFAGFSIPVRTVSRMDPVELADRCGYSIDDATRAQRRHASVLLVDLDHSDPGVTGALMALSEAGCSVASGGRWTSVVKGADKGTAVRHWLAGYMARTGTTPAVVAGIGDAENDAPLLNAVSLPFVIRVDRYGHSPLLSAVPGARLLECVGTAGWREMLDILDSSRP